MAVTDLLAFLPKSVALTIAAMVLGAGTLAGLESRYVTQSDFHKSYVLQLKREIRELRKELAEESDPERIADLEYDLAELIDELCIEAPEDRECS